MEKSIITNSIPEDLQPIFQLYAQAQAHQQKIGTVVVWPNFDPAMVRKEISDNHQWKLLIGGQIACVWATTFSDEQIWEERNQDAAVYIHRIATNPDFRGQNFVKQIVDWAKAYAKAQQKEYVRLDTLGNNTRLIEHYTRAGFDFLGMFEMKDTIGLPTHYHGAPVCLFELKVA